MFILEYAPRNYKQPCGAVRWEASVYSSTVELEARKEYRA